MSYILSTKYARKSDCDFVVAAARAFYCDWWLSDEKRERRISGPGVELTDRIPETQRWAFRLARKFVRDLEAAGGQELPFILTDFEACWDASLPSAGRNGAYSEENAGWYAAMEAMGHGVGLFCFGIDFSPMPHVQAYPGADWEPPSAEKTHRVYTKEAPGIWREFGVDYTRTEAMAVARQYRRDWPGRVYTVRKIRRRGAP